VLPTDIQTERNIPSARFRWLVGSLYVGYIGRCSSIWHLYFKWVEIEPSITDKMLITSSAFIISSGNCPLVNRECARKRRWIGTFPAKRESKGTIIRLLITFVSIVVIGERGSVYGWGTMLQARRSRVRVPMRWILFFNSPNPSSRTAALAVDSASNRNEYQESSRGVKGGGRLRLTTLAPSVSRLPRENVGASTSHNPIGLDGLLQG
jgi:hypothetical protein